MSKKKKRLCLQCKAEVLPMSQNKAFPFCSARCQRVDLGGWLAEAYTIASEPMDPTAADFTRGLGKTSDFN